MLGKDLLSMTGALLAVVFVLLLAYCFSRGLGRTWVRTARGSTIKIIGQLQVGADRHLLLVRLMERNFLIGSSPAGIQLLTEIEGELPEDTPAAGKVPDHTFGNLLRKYASSHRNNKEEDHE